MAVNWECLAVAQMVAWKVGLLVVCWVVLRAACLAKRMVGHLVAVKAAKWVAKLVSNWVVQTADWLVVMRAG